MPWARGGASRRRMPFAAFVVAGAVALGGCTGQSEPDPSPSAGSASATSSASPSVTPSPSPSVTASGPEIPPSAREQTEAGAEAFVRFYIAQSARAWVEADASQLAGLATANCATCSNLEETAVDLRADGQKYSAVPIKVISLSVFRRSKAEVVFDAELREQNVSVVDSKGSVVESFPARTLTSAVAVVWKEGQWWVDAIGE